MTEPWLRRLDDLGRARAEEKVRELLDGPVEPVDVGWPLAAQIDAGGAEMADGHTETPPGRPAGSEGVTEADRERAMFVLFPELADRVSSYIHGLTFSDEAEANMHDIAAALAEERAKARAPFLALGREYHDIAQSIPDDSDGHEVKWVYAGVSADIELAAEETK
jgi:hypothetical protein